MPDAQAAGPTRRAVAVAGHTGDVETARAGLVSDDPAVRATALGALERLGALDDASLAARFLDDDAAVRRRAAEVAATHRGVDLLPLLGDRDPNVVEVAAWACGEHEQPHDPIVDRLVDLAGGSRHPLVREAAVAALGAIGDPRARAVTVRAAREDKPAVRRRAVLALAAYDGDDVDAALDAALEDRDWQVRQAAEDLRRAIDRDE